MDKKTILTLIIFLVSVSVVFGALYYKDTILDKKPEQVKVLGERIKEELPKIDTVEVEQQEQKDYTGGIMELLKETIKPGEGAEITNGQTAEVHYTGNLLDGTKFDSSKDRNQTFEFKLGEGRVIQGWEQGVLGMKRGEVRKLTIPYNLAYGEQGSGPIPPKATLVFEVELVNIK